MNDNDLNIELIANIKDCQFAIVEFESLASQQPPQKQQKSTTPTYSARAKIKIINESQYRTIELSEKGYRQIEQQGRDNEDEWFETLSTLLQEKSESFQTQMMATLFSKLNSVSEQ